MGISSSVTHSPDVSNNYTLENIRFRKCVEDHLGKYYKIVLIKILKTGDIQISHTKDHMDEEYYSESTCLYRLFSEKKLLFDYLYKMYSRDIFSYIKSFTDGKLVDKRLIFYIYRKCIREVLEYIYSLKDGDVDKSTKTDKSTDKRIYYKDLMSRLCLFDRLQIDYEFER